MICFSKDSSVFSLLRCRWRYFQLIRVAAAKVLDSVWIPRHCLSVIVALGFGIGCSTLEAQNPSPTFKVIAFYTGKSDQAHISFVREANQWFAKMAAQVHFGYTSTTNWTDLNDEILGQYQVVLFLDTRPEQLSQREAFQNYMERGGAWMG